MFELQVLIFLLAGSDSIPSIAWYDRGHEAFLPVLGYDERSGLMAIFGSKYVDFEPMLEMERKVQPGMQWGVRRAYFTKGLHPAMSTFSYLAPDVVLGDLHGTIAAADSFGQTF